jgi:hypothetical protein
MGRACSIEPGSAVRSADSSGQFGSGRPEQSYNRVEAGHGTIGRSRYRVGWVIPSICTDLATFGRDEFVG